MEWQEPEGFLSQNNINGSGGCEPCGKKTCLVCDSISTATTFTTKVCLETFKIQSGPLTCGSEKVLYLLKLFPNHHCLDSHSGIVDWDFMIFQQFEIHTQLKEREAFWQRRLKTFYPIDVNDKEEYLY